MLQFLFKHTRIPVFCYHGMNANSLEYKGNDHLALVADLQQLKSLGYRAISAMDVVRFIKGELKIGQGEKVFCLTFDDAPILDYEDYQSPTIGLIKSFKSIVASSGLFNNEVRPISFVIANEQARDEIDKKCIRGDDDLSSDWWQTAIEEGSYDIGNHSFDHMHARLSKPVHSRGEKGSFLAVDNYLDADKQIRQAQDEIDLYTKQQATPLFAYPYGDVSEYLVAEYFPQFEHEHRQQGAFTTDGTVVEKTSNHWAIPRYVCGAHWKTEADFSALLRSL